MIILNKGIKVAEEHKEILLDCQNYYSKGCLSGKLHKIDSGVYVRNFIFLIPFIHAFGRVGCFLAGCCYGRPYEGTN